MKKVINYFTKPHRMLALLSYIYGGYGTYWVIHESNIPFPFKVVSGILFALLFIFGLASLIKEMKKLNGVVEIIRLPDVKEAPAPVPDKMKDIAIPLPRDYTEIGKQFSIKATLIRIIVYHGENILTALKEDIIDAIKKNNVEVRLLIVKKDSALIEEVWDLENRTEYQKLDIVRKLIDEIKKEVGNKSYKLKWREYNTQARYALVAFDSRWAWWTPYHPGKRVENTTSFILTDEGKKSIVHECIEHFDALWNKLEQDEKQN